MLLKKEPYGKSGRQVSCTESIAYVSYSKVFTLKQLKSFESFDIPTFLYGLRLGEEIENESGKTFIVKLVSIVQQQADGIRMIYFELYGQPREVMVKDESI